MPNQSTRDTTNGDIRLSHSRRKDCFFVGECGQPEMDGTENLIYLSFRLG